MTCIFCEIVRNEREAYIVSKGKTVTVFLDINPVAKGHLLVVPNKHFENLHHIDDEETLDNIGKSLKMAATQLVNSGICKDYSIIQANGSFAEQEIQHLHFHIIPRHLGDDVMIKLPTDKSSATKECLKETLEIISSSFN